MDRDTPDDEALRSRVEFCAVCDTPLGWLDGAYVHLRGFKERHGCMTPIPHP